MPPTRFVIDVFKNLAGIAEIIALGAIRRQPSVAMEAEIAVLLASNLDDPAFDHERDMRIEWIGCGQLDLLTVGSRWKQGRHAGETPAKRFSSSYGFKHLEKLGTGVDDPNRYRRRLPTGSMAELPCFLLEEKGEGMADAVGRPRRVLLPQIELVRALFGVSSRLLIELIDGVRDPRVADRGILDRRNSKHLADGTVRLICWRKPTDEEALILAAMVADSTLMELHDEVFQQLVVQKEYHEYQLAWPTVTWPFRDSITLTLEGRWFTREDGFSRFLATRITEIDLNLNFRRIEVHYPDAGGEQAPERLPPPTGRMRSTNARLVVLTTGKSPSPLRLQVEIPSELVAIPQSRGVEIEFVGNSGPPRPRLSTLGEYPRERGEFSTAGRESGADPSIGRALIRRMVGADASVITSVREQTLRFTWDALRAAATESGWRITPYPIADAWSPLPSDGGFDFRREGLLAGLNVGGRHLIIVDEREAPQDGRSLGILLKTDGTSVKRPDLQMIRMTHDEVEGHWGSPDAKVPKFEVFPVPRSAAIMTDAAAYAAKLRRKIGRVAKNAG